MLHSASRFDFSAESPFDIVIVGTGAVGLTVAIRLARAGIRVLALEAGPEKPATASQILFESACATGQDLPGLHIGRFRNLGGTTAFWGGQLVPFGPQVFSDRPWVVQNGWPIKYSDLADFYQESFEICGLKDVIRSDSEIWARLGVTAPAETSKIKPFFTSWIPEPNLAIKFGDEIRASKNLIVLSDAQVVALDVDDSGTVCAAEIVLLDRSRIKVSGNHFILANGTIEISRLLMLPASSGATPPWGANDWIGRGFIDHLDCVAGTVIPIDGKRFSDLFDNVFLDGIKYSPKLRMSDEIQNDEKLLEISAHFIFRSSISENLANLKLLVKGLLRGKFSLSSVGDPFRLLGTLRFVIPMAIRYLRYRRMLNFSDGGIQLRLTGEQMPLADSRITLQERQDALGIPQVDVNWKIDPRDLETTRRFSFFLKDYLEGQGIATVNIDSTLAEGNKEFIESVDDANHHMGGARMATSAETGVVDRNCLVFGSKNLYVAGQAVYPASGFGNPTFTAISLGQRLAAHLAKISRKEA